MSKVQRFWCDEARNIRCVREDDFDALAAEAQALREEVAALKHSQQVLIGSRNAHRDERDAALKEVAALRARVVVAPERLGTTTSQGLMDVMTLHHHLGWNACLDELARFNGKTVSEGLLRDLLKSAQKLSDRAAGFSISGVEFMEIGDNNSAIVELEVTLDELRALLNQDKENGNG